MIIDFSQLRLDQLQPATAFEVKVTAFLNDWYSDTVEVSVQTSGSTGVPKIFPIAKDRMRNSAQMTCGFLNLKPQNSALLCLPVEYISGKMMIVRSAECNLKLIVEEPSAAPLKRLNVTVDFCAMTPLQVENSLDKIHLIKNLIIGGAAVSESLKRKIHISLQKTPTANRQPLPAIYETYGMSETLSHIGLKQIFPEPQSHFHIFDGIEISTDGRGCLRIFAPTLNSDVLQTNDLVEIKNEKEFRFLGRIDNVINSGGAKIFPEQLESLVKKEIPNEVVFLGIPDEALGQKLILVIEGEEDDHLRMKIHNLQFEKSFHRPKKILFTNPFPRTPNGKVDRLALNKLVLDL